MADRRGIIVPLLILAFIFLSPDPARAPARQLYTGRTIDDVIVDEQHALAQLRNSTYSTQGVSALNVTGLEDGRGYALGAVPAVRERARIYVDSALGDASDHALNLLPGVDFPPLYKNTTGFVHGEWVRSPIQADLPAPHLNMTHYATFSPFGFVIPHEFGRNITGKEGNVRMRFHERQVPQSKSLDANVVDNVVSFDTELTLTDLSREHNLRLRGVYFPNAGQAMLTTTSEKYAGIFLLPQMALSQRMFEVSKALLNDSISRTIQRQVERQLDKFNPWSSSIEGAPENSPATPECELVVYLQQLPPVSSTPAVMTSSIIALLEKELRFPTGAFVPSAPEMRFSMLIFSPDCGFVLESKGPPDFSPREAAHLVGPKVEVLNKTSRNHVLFFTTVLVLQLLLLKRQMREASTPSTQSRISLYTVAMLSLGDGFTFMTFLLISFFIGGLWVTIMATAFVSFICVSFFGMRFLLDVWTVQAPERARRRREEAEEDRRRNEMFQNSLLRIRATQEARFARAGQQPGNQGTNVAPPAGGHTVLEQNANAPSGPPALAANTTTQQAARPLTALPPNSATNQLPTDSLPLPVTTPRPTDTGAIPVFMPSDQQGLEPITQPGTTTQQTTPLPRESFGSLYTRFYLLLLAILFLSLNAAAWPSGFRRAYFTFLGFVYLSFWLPQINRNVQRNCRKAFTWEFVIGQSILRYVPFLYFYSYSGNVIFADADYISLAILGAWIWLQLLVLVSQEIVGPRWFVRKEWAPPAYDYHPVLREDEEGATMPIGFSQATESAAATDPASQASPESPVAGRERSDSQAKEKGKRVFDCAICMQDLEVPVVESGGAAGDSGLAGTAGFLARRLYMVTPCRHIFHSACLEGWMKYRLQCPICRETLPPL